MLRVWRGMEMRPHGGWGGRSRTARVKVGGGADGRVRVVVEGELEGERVKVRAAVAVLVVGWVWSASGQAIGVRFDREDYVVQPGASVAIQVSLDTTLAKGLYSYGEVLVYDPLAGRVVDLDSIVVPTELNFNGVEGPGALKHISDGAVGVKGTVDFFAQSTASYSGRVLATFKILPLAPGDYVLKLKPFNTLGPTESVFIGGDGTKLDDQIGFGSAQLHVIPEPSGMALMMWGGSVFLLKRSLRRLSSLRRAAHG